MELLEWTRNEANLWQKLMKNERLGDFKRKSIPDFFFKKKEILSNKGKIEKRVVEAS